VAEPEGTPFPPFGGGSGWGVVRCDHAVPHLPTPTPPNSSPQGGGEEFAALLRLNLAPIGPGPLVLEALRSTLPSLSPSETINFCDEKVAMVDPEAGSKNDKEFQVIVSALDDCRRLIAAGKVQRWEVVKWGVAVNVALAAAAAAPALGHNLSLFWLAVAVAIASLLLVGHYNKRISGARETATTLIDRLKWFGIDYDAIARAKRTKTNPTISHTAGEYYDWRELFIFSIILVVSPFLVLLSLIR
jgi:hypothetical protein